MCSCFQVVLRLMMAVETSNLNLGLCSELNYFLFAEQQLTIVLAVTMSFRDLL